MTEPWRSGSGTACPFELFSNALDESLFLRNTYVKNLIVRVGGLPL
jgi:hypothetical protein